MIFLADENFPRRLVARLRKGGLEVAWIREDSPGSDDKSVLARAQVECRVLLTFDKDFGELAFRANLPAFSGVILFRVSRPSPAFTAERIIHILASRSDWQGRFAVVEDFRIRFRDLPA